MFARTCCGAGMDFCLHFCFPVATRCMQFQELLANLILKAFCGSFVVDSFFALIVIFYSVKWRTSPMPAGPMNFWKINSARIKLPAARSKNKDEYALGACCKCKRRAVLCTRSHCLAGPRPHGDRAISGKCYSDCVLRSRRLCLPLLGSPSCAMQLQLLADR